MLASFAMRDLPEVSGTINDTGLSHLPTSQSILLPSESPNCILVSCFGMLLQLKKYTSRLATSLMPDLASQKRFFIDRFDLLTPTSKMFSTTFGNGTVSTESRNQSPVHTNDLEGCNSQSKPSWYN